MDQWNPNHYLQFDNERTQAAIDLATRIQLDTPLHIVDLGCGPGNSTAVLHARWLNASITGIDYSMEMIEAAKASHPNHLWEQSDITEWTPTTSPNLIYANAALHWVRDHENLIPKLFNFLTEDGVFAFHIPSHIYPKARQLLFDLSLEPEWQDATQSARDRFTIHPPAFYYDLLSNEAKSIDLWETEYIHVMPSADAIVDWFASTGLRPFLNALSNQTERNNFKQTFRKRINNAYTAQPDGNVLFPFRRMFAIAYR